MSYCLRCLSKINIKCLNKKKNYSVKCIYIFALNIRSINAHLNELTLYLDVYNSIFDVIK